MAENPAKEGGLQAGPSGASRISLDHLVAFNDELAALVRAGVPLESGLCKLGADIPGKLGETMQLLAARMSRGESLPDAMAAERNRFPGVYCAVVRAGLKAGRMCAALEGLGSFARSYADMRRAIGLALVYPLILVMFAYGLFLFFVLTIAPNFLAAFEFLHLPSQTFLVRLRATVGFWGPVVPGVFLVLAYCWLQSGRAGLLQPEGVGGSLRFLPWVQRIIANFQTANFAELLGLLVEHEVPLHEAILLAGEATGSSVVFDGAKELAAAAERGESLQTSLLGSRLFPPLLRWLILTGIEQGRLARALRHAAETYRGLARHQASMLQSLLPAVLLLMFGATATLLYGLTLFVPFTALLHNLSMN